MLKFDGNEGVADRATWMCLGNYFLAGVPALITAARLR